MIVLLLCYLGFVSLGLPDTLIGVAWPSVREAFGLRQSDVSWIFALAGCTYFVSSFFAGRLLKAMNVGTLLALSSGLVALSGFQYSLAPGWAVFACGALLHGLGSGAIDSGLNHYVASHFSARHMNWLHACYSVGAMLGPLAMTAAVVHLRAWRLGYLFVAGILALLALAFFATNRHWTGGPAAKTLESHEARTATSAWETLRYPLVWLHLVLFFVYVGLEVAIGQWSFTVLTESRGVSPQRAGVWVSGYWASILAGRVLLGFVVDRLGIDRLIRFSIATAGFGAALFAWNPHRWASPAGLALAGLGLAVIFPCLMSRTPQRLGKDLALHAIGFQVGAGMLGAAVLPSAAGFLAQFAGLALVPAALLATALVLWLAHETVLLLARKASIAIP